MGPSVHQEVEPALAESLHQWLWREAGGFGARLVLITVEAAHAVTLAGLHEQFTTWECDRLDSIVALDRASARSDGHVALVQQATAVVLVGDQPMQWAAILGGTPLAQTIRRANARSKLTAGIGAVSAFLCQHIITPGSQPEKLAGAVAFGPGLGLVNRLVVDATHVGVAHSQASQRRLLAAVAANPFLIGVGLAAGSAAILYPDNTLQASSPNTVAIVDGQAVEAANLNAESVEAIVGASPYELHMGDGFNLDEHIFRAAGEIDLPPTGPVTSVF
jgi:cyanophycinase